MSEAEPQRRWYRLTPDRLLIGVLAAEFLLLLADRFGWFGLKPGGGWNVLFCIALVGLTGLIALFWFCVSLVFRRRFQYSLRTLFVLVAVCAVACSWFAVKVRRAREQREAVAAIKGTGGSLSYDDDWFYPSDDSIPAAIIRRTWRLRRWLKIDFFSDVVEVDMSTPGLGRDQVEHVRLLVYLQRLYLEETLIGDAELERLKGLNRLRELWLCGTQVTNAGLRHLKGLNNLEYLHLKDTKVGDAGLEYLARLTTLKRLGIANTAVTDAGLEHLQRLTNLQWLFLEDTLVTDEGVGELQRALPKCKIRN